MAAEIELKKINEYVSQLVAVTSITDAYVYGIDSNGNSIKIAVEVLASAGTDYSQQITELTTKCNNNNTLITALQSAVNGKANAVHTHQQSDITGLTTALEGKAAASHTHAQSDITGLTTALNGKANAVHSHQQSDISGLSDALAGKAAAEHTHNQSDITGLTTALEGKADTDHTHEIADVEGLQTSLNNITTRVEDLEQTSGPTNGVLKQRDLSAYAGDADEIAQHRGATTAELHDGWTYKCTVGETVKTIAAGTDCIRFTQGGRTFVSDGSTEEYDVNCIFALKEADDVAYTLFFGSIVGSYAINHNCPAREVPNPSRYAWHDGATLVTVTAINSTSYTLSNGVTLTITSWAGDTTPALILYDEASGEKYHGCYSSNFVGNRSLYLVSATTDSNGYLVPSEPLGTAFGGEKTVFTATEGIVIRSHSWTRHGTQPPTDVASGDNFLTLSNDKIGSTIDIAYNSGNQHLELKGNGGAVVSYVDMAVFIKDGMLENVEKYTTPEQGVTVAVPYLKFTFNTDSGKSVIRISFADLIDTFDGSNVDLTSAFVKAATYSAPAIGDSMNVAIGKLLKGHEDNAEAIATKQDSLTFDSTPTANSTKPVTSGGIKAAIDSAIGGVPDALKQVDLTTYQDSTEGEIVEHVGATTSAFVNGYIYKRTSAAPYPADTKALSMSGLTRDETDPVDVLAMISDTNFFKSQETATLYEGDSTSSSERYNVYQLYIGDKDAPAIGDSVMGDNRYFQLYNVTEVSSAVYPFAYKCSDTYGSVNVTRSFEAEIYENSDGVKIICYSYYSDNYMESPGVVYNEGFCVIYGGKLHKIMAETVWVGNSDLLTPPPSWVQWNVQPSSEGAVSDLETRMTAAETAINGKQPTITGAASSITTNNLTASKVLGSDANGKVAATSIATTDAEDAVSKRHTQNTDTKIVSGTRKIEVGSSGIDIIGATRITAVNSSGVSSAMFRANATGISLLDNTAVTGNLSVSGNLNVTGKETVTEIVNIKSENNFITLRDGAQTAVASGSLSGTKVENYDGLGNNLLFGTDASGTFRIGDEGGTLEPILTRAEATHINNGDALVWDATNQRAIGKGVDSTPQSGSSDLVESGGVNAAIINSQRVFYAITETAGATAVKEFTITDFPTETINGVKTPLKGTIITVTSTNTDATRTAPLQFKINDGGTFPLYWKSTQWTTLTYNPKIFGKTTSRYTYIFEGAYWNWLGNGFESDTQYSAGIGLKLNSSNQFSLNVPRVAKSANSLPGKNTAIIEEYQNGDNYNLPTNAWYHILTMEGNDTTAATQLALCANNNAGIYYRRMTSSVWQSWKRLDNPTMDSTPTAGNTSNVVSSAGIKTYVDTQVATKSNVIFRQWVTQ